MCSKETSGGARCRFRRGDLFEWDPRSTYVRKPPFVEHITKEPAPLSDINDARVLALLGDSITTDHISPAGSIPADTPAGQVPDCARGTPSDFNSYGARRGNHEVMMRGTFANTRLRNQLAPGTEGGWTTYRKTGVRRADDYLRRVDEISGRLGCRCSSLRARSTARARRATGRQKAHCCWGSCGHCGELRTYSPQQSRQHGCAASAVQTGGDGRIAGPDRARILRHCRRDLTPRATLSVRVRPSDGKDREIQVSRAHRHPGRADGVPPRRHPALRIASASR